VSAASARRYNLLRLSPAGHSRPTERAARLQERTKGWTGKGGIVAVPASTDGAPRYVVPVELWAYIMDLAYLR
jgi:hypothetical protein